MYIWLITVKENQNSTVVKVVKKTRFYSGTITIRERDLSIELSSTYGMDKQRYSQAGWGSVDEILRENIKSRGDFS